MNHAVGRDYDNVDRGHHTYHDDHNKDHYKYIYISSIYKSTP